MICPLGVFDLVISTAHRAIERVFFGRTATFVRNRGKCFLTGRAKEAYFVFLGQFETILIFIFLE